MLDEKDVAAPLAVRTHEHVAAAAAVGAKVMQVARIDRPDLDKSARGCGSHGGGGAQRRPWRHHVTTIDNPDKHGSFSGTVPR
jgi:hypothetical protein